MSDAEARREELRDKVLASRAELESHALPDAEPPEGYVALAMDYPFAAIAGGLLLGFAAGALLPRGAGRKALRGALAAASVANEVGRVYGRKAIEAADEATRESREKLGELGATVGENAGRQARRVVSATGKSARRTTDLGIRIAREAIRLSSNLRH